MFHSSQQWLIAPKDPPPCLNIKHLSFFLTYSFFFIGLTSGLIPLSAIHDMSSVVNVSPNRCSPKITHMCRFGAHYYHTNNVCQCCKSTCIPTKAHSDKQWHQVGWMHLSTSDDTLLYCCYAPLFSKITMRLKCKSRHMLHHLWSITTCFVLKNERLYLKHERQICFSFLFILVHFPWGLAMSVSVDALIEMCEVKTIVYISSRDLRSSIISLSLFSWDYTGFKGKNSSL